MKLATTFILTAFTLLSSPSTHAGPLAERQLATLSQDEINSFLPYSLFAKTGYCGPAKTQNWNCGTWCEQLPGFTTVASGGNGGAIQNWYVGYYPTFSSVVVGYQGTNLSNIEAILTDLNFFPRTPSQSLFPGLPSSAKVHGGFLDAYSKTQAAVFAGVQQALTTFGTNKVILTGHSLGGALATISAASMKLRLGPDYSFKVVSYSCPRIGDRNWVDWVDSNLEVTRVTNKACSVKSKDRMIDYVLIERSCSDSSRTVTRFCRKPGRNPYSCIRRGVGRLPRQRLSRGRVHYRRRSKYPRRQLHSTYWSL